MWIHPHPFWSNSQIHSNIIGLGIYFIPYPTLASDDEIVFLWYGRMIPIGCFPIWLCMSGLYAIRVTTSLTFRICIIHNPAIDPCTTRPETLTRTHPRAYEFQILNRQLYWVLSAEPPVRFAPHNTGSEYGECMHVKLIDLRQIQLYRLNEASGNSNMHKPYAYKVLLDNITVLIVCLSRTALLILSVVHALYFFVPKRWRHTFLAKHVEASYISLSEYPDVSVIIN